MARPRGETRAASRKYREWLRGVRSGAIKLAPIRPDDQTAMTFLKRSSRPVRRGDR